MILKRIELYFKEIMKGKKGLFPFLLRIILLPFSWVYYLGSSLRNRLYDSGWMRCYVSPAPLVISVGNIVAGGTGKTPVALKIAAFFYERYPLAIVSRGYRSQVEKMGRSVVLCEGEGPVFPAEYCGDEPYLFASHFPKALVAVGVDRKKAVVSAIKKGAEVIILDDAFQHRMMGRDYDVVVIDAKDPFGAGYFLPRGFLRDSPSSLKRADLLVFNNVEDEEHAKKVEELLRPYTKAPFVAMQAKIDGFYNLDNEAVLLSEEEKTVGMFCGIANPSYFRALLSKAGVTVAIETLLADHEGIGEKKLNKLAEKAAKLNAKWLVCTEKDKVKFQRDFKLPLPILWVAISQVVILGQENWDAFLNKAKDRLK